jgi:hypothetical protein|tara:strand:+ start:492 stop:629 length:138 start_codon:yes stop_codon:yes gene_type:complete
MRKYVRVKPKKLVMEVYSRLLNENRLLENGAAIQRYRKLRLRNER